MIERSSDWVIPGGGSIRTCGPSDLIILKAFANRPRDWPLIETELTQLANLKEEPEIVEQLQALRKRSPSCSLEFDKPE